MKLSKEMIKSDPVKAALALAKRAIATDPVYAKAMLIEKRKLLAKTVELRADLLEIEGDSAAKLDNQIVEIKQDIKSLIGQIMPSPTTMPVFDLTCLSWRDERNFPRLVPFNINDKKVFFAIRCRRMWRNDLRTINASTKFSKLIAEQYKDVFKTLRTLRQPKKSIEIAAVFSGNIPDDIRDLIQSARSVFDDLRIVAEVSNWTVVERNVPPARTRKGDPLLIGFDGKDYRLIAAFDTTSIEKIALERSKGQRGS